MKAIKTIIKKILPTPFLKSAFLIYNKVKIVTIDRFLFPEYKIDQQDFLIFRKGFPFRECGINLDDMPGNKVKTYMQDWFQWTQEEFIIEVKQPCWIEPDYGWAIVGPNKLIYYSLGVSRTWFQPKPNLFSLLRKKNTQKLSRAISLRDSGEENYFHFYNDVVAKLHFLELHNFNISSLPVIISRKLWNKEYFQYYLKSSETMKSISWVIQDSQYIHCDAVIFCKPLTHRKDLWNSIISPVKINHPNPDKKIFITRNKSRLRFIENIGEIDSICRQRGFEVIDSDTLSPAEQILIFSQASCIVGIHGAGLTNMVFSGEGCKVMELFSPPDQGYLPFHYIMLAKMGNMRYRAVIGEPGRISYSGGFYLDKNEFLNELVEFGL